MEIPFKKLESLSEAETLLDDSQLVFADTETDGLYGKVTLLQLYQKGADEVLLVQNPDAYFLAKFLDNYEVVYHNSHYDITTIQQNSAKWLPKNFIDTFYLSRLFFADKEKFSLDACYTYVLGFDPYLKQGIDKKEMQKTNWGGYLSPKQLAYAATDVYFMPVLYDAVKSMQDTTVYQLDKLTTDYCLDFQWNGMPVDEERLDERFTENEAKIAEIDMPINVNSYRQVRPYIGSEESDALGLARLTLQGNTKAENVQTVRKIIKQQSFLKKFNSAVGRIFGKFLPSTRSGRLASKDQNLQQLPRALKEVFGVKPDSGRILIYSDYAQLELRTICAITACKLMEQLFRAGEDLHAYTAKMLFGENWTKKHRQISKTANFSLLYGGGVGMFISILILQAGIWIEEREANNIRKKWRNLWKEIYAWQEKGISMWRKGKLGSTPLGRRYKAKMMTDQLNIENQGAGAEVAKLALHYIVPKVNKYNEDHSTDFILCNFIHDSFIFEGPDEPEHYQAVAKIVAEGMQQAWAEMSKLFKVQDLPMPVSVLCGYNWGDIEDDDIDNVWDYSLDGMACFKEAA